MPNLKTLQDKKKKAKVVLKSDCGSVQLKAEDAARVVKEVVKQKVKEKRKEDRNTFQQAVKSFEQDGSLVRLNNLVSMIFLLRAECSRIMGEVELLLERGKLVYGEVKHKLNRVHDAEDQFYYLMKQLVDEGGMKEFASDSDRFDVDFYNYMGIRQGWKPGEESSFASFIGIQNLIHVGTAEKGEARKVLIGRNADGTLWIAENEQTESVYTIPGHLLPNIQPKEVFWVNLDPIIKIAWKK